MAADLSILVVTRLDDVARPFLAEMSRVAFFVGAEFVVAVDTFGKIAISFASIDYRVDRIERVASKGYIESVLDQAVSFCSREYVLRLDDDEKCSGEMVGWLACGFYRNADHWKFPRLNLWPTSRGLGAIMSPHLWPDEQTRLSTREKSGGRYAVHAGSPYGGGRPAPCAIEHHKFVVKSRDERLRIAKSYDAFAPGYGTGGMKPFSLPEDAYASFDVVGYGNGRVPFEPTWIERVENGVTA